MVTISRCDETDGLTEHTNVDGTLKTTSNSKMDDATSTSSHERDSTVDTTVNKNDLSSSLRPCSRSVVLSITEIGRNDKSDVNSKGKSPRKFGRKNSNSTAGLFDSSSISMNVLIPRNVDRCKKSHKRKPNLVKDSCKNRKERYQIIHI